MCTAVGGSGAFLFGGSQSGGELADAWRWDGTGWTIRAGGPPARSRHAVAYDVLRDRVVLFGGMSASGPCGDTWEWDGAVWRQWPVAGPAPRSDAAMAFDFNRGRVVLFGGRGAAQCMADTWRWDGTDWSRAAPATRPPARADHAMAFDVLRDRVVLFGGSDAGGIRLGDTWEWDGVDWRQRMPANAPGARAGHALAWIGDPVLSFGGDNGAAETWIYGTAAPASWVSFGSPCRGSAGPPLLAPVGGSLPWLGEGLKLGLANVPPGNAAVVLVGGSNASWGGAPLPLPLPLAFAGMPGCSLLVRPDLALPAVGSMGMATWRISVCSCPQLVGAAMFAQGVVADPAANAAGFVLSGAGTAVVGVR